MSATRGKDSTVPWQCSRGRLTIVVLLLLLQATPFAVRAADEESVDALIARMDAVWKERDRHGAVPDLVTLATLAKAIDAQNYDVEWRLARAYFWVAYTQSNRVVKKAMAGKAIETADHARQLRPNAVEGQYFYAVALGEYASTIGIMQAVVDGVAGKVETAAQRAYAADRDYENGAPGTVLGRFYFMLPWPKRDLKLSRHYLEEVVERHPQALLAHDYLADTYYDLGEHDKARAQLVFVLENDIAPGTELDRPQPKPLARESMQRWFPESLPDGARAK
jgi:tetratricopeptide (TPR) repeat protein